MLLAALFSLGASAQEPVAGFDFRRPGSTGIGLINGPFLSGLSIEHHVTSHDALQVGIGAAWGTYRYWPAHGIGLSLDYVHHPPSVYEGPDVRLGWSIGLGAQARVRPVPGDVRYAAGVHLVAGFDIMLVHAPVDLAFEYRPGIVGVPGPGGLTFAFGDVAVHLRWWMRGKRRGSTGDVTEPTVAPEPASDRSNRPAPAETTDPPAPSEGGPS